MTPPLNVLALHGQIEEYIADLIRELTTLRAKYGAAIERLHIAELGADRAQHKAERAQVYHMCKRMMIEASPLGTDEAPYQAWLDTHFPEYARTGGPTTHD